MQIRQQLAAASTKHYNGVNAATSITVHETANLTPGATAAMHANLQSRGNVRNASWHWQVDDVEAVQSFEHTTQCWHAGDGHGPGNLTSIAIEVCVNGDGDFVQAVRNAASLIRHIRALTPSVQAVVQHNAWSGKDCPNFLRDGSRGVTWAQFLTWCEPEPAPTPLPAPPAPVPNTPEEDVMSKLPALDWSTQDTRPDAMTGRVQGLLAADGRYGGRLDDRRGPLSIAGLRAFQIAHNCGGGGGRADLLIGPKSWESLLLGTVW